MAAVEIAPITEVPIPEVPKHDVDVKVEEKQDEVPLGFDPTALKNKYLEERDRRLKRGKSTFAGNGTEHTRKTACQGRLYGADIWKSDSTVHAE